MAVATWFKGNKGKEQDAAAERTQQVEPVVIAEAHQHQPVHQAPPVQPQPVQQPQQPVVPDGVAPEVVEQLAAERKAMVALCLYAHDRARSSGVAERLEEGLAGVGVTALRPDGQRFDPSLHEAGGTVITDDPALDGTVAETEVVGFSDRGQVLRVPIVTVYKASAQ